MSHVHVHYVIRSTFSMAYVFVMVCVMLVPVMFVLLLLPGVSFKKAASKELLHERVHSTVTYLVDYIRHIEERFGLDNILLLDLDIEVR